jgi:hypothetical protein
MEFSRYCCFFHKVCTNHQVSSILNLICCSIFLDVEFSLTLKILLSSGEYFIPFIIFNGIFLSLSWAKLIDHGYYFDSFHPRVDH